MRWKNGATRQGDVGFEDQSSLRRLYPPSCCQAFGERAGRRVCGRDRESFFTTDSAASLRAIEINAELMIKATKVKGVYSADPEKVKDAIFYPRLTYDEALDQRLNVMDTTALALCRDNNVPMRVMNIFEQGAIKRLMLGEEIGSLIERGT